MTPKQIKTINKVKNILGTSALGIDFSELLSLSELSPVTLKKTLVEIGATQNPAGLWLLPSTDTVDAESEPEQVADVDIQVPVINNAENIPSETGKTSKNHDVTTVINNPKPIKAVKRHKPFTPNPTCGYQVEKDKVKIFLERKAGSRTLTLSIHDLRELVHAVEKCEV